MSTKIYGASDDLIEFEGDVRGEVGCYGTHESEHGVMIVCSDGTLLEVKYGKLGLAIWGITPIAQGALFDHIDSCVNEDAKIYSDIAHFKDGMKWCIAATEWQRVR